MESRGNVGHPSGGPESFASTLHWGPDWSSNQYAKTHAEYKHASGLLSDDFHTYGMYWDKTHLYTYIDSDSNKVLQVPMNDKSFWDKSQITNRENPWQYSKDMNAPFDSEFYLIINLAVGGTNGYFPDGVAGKPWSDHSERASAEFIENKGSWFDTWGDHSTFQIDSVKMWSIDVKEDGQQ